MHTQGDISDDARDEDETPSTIPAPKAISPSETVPDKSAIYVSPVARFWRRLAAFLVDGFILAFVAQVIGFLFRDFLFGIGPYGRFIGLALLLSYFGLLNSGLFNGQTIGKRLLRIAVRDRDGRPISLPRALLRTIILVLPLMLNGWQLPLLTSNPNPILYWADAVLVFGVGSALVYTMLFNWKTRQGIHDLACQTYAVKLPLAQPVVFPQTRRIHWIVSLGLITASMLVLAVLMLVTLNNSVGSSFAPMQNVQTTLSADERFFTWNILDQRVFSTQQQSLRILNVTGWYKGLPTREEQTALINGVAKTVLQSYPGIDQFDRLSVVILTEYDLGIAEAHVAQGDIEPISVWRSR